MRRKYIFITFSDLRPAVGVISFGSDSGIGSFGSSKCIPGHPIHKPLPFITTGATAVTKPPALKRKMHHEEILHKTFAQVICTEQKCTKKDLFFYSNAHLAFLTRFPSLVLCNTNGNRLETTIILPEDVITSAISIVKLNFNRIKFIIKKKSNLFN